MTHVEPPPAGWSYCLTPHLELRDRPPPAGSPAASRVLVLASGQAFPLGHPTTRLSLDLLVAAWGEAPPASLLDVGCGGGVLSLAAAALGVPRVLAVDLAAPAVRTTRRNAHALGLASQVAVVQGSPACLRGHHALVVANLPYEVQLDLAADLVRLTARRGRLILSGFREHQEANLLAAYTQLGCTCRRRVVKPFSHPELPPYLSFTWVAWLLEAGLPG